MPSRRSATSLIPSLFELPTPPADGPGSQNWRVVVCHLVGEMLKNTPKDRFQVAADMSRLSGREVSKNMLDAYSAEGREDFNAPAYLMPCLEVSTESHLFTNWLSGIRGGRFLVGRETLNAELGRLERIREEASKRIRDLKKLMGEAE